MRFEILVEPDLDIAPASERQDAILADTECRRDAIEDSRRVGIGHARYFEDLALRHLHSIELVPSMNKAPERLERISVRALGERLDDLLAALVVIRSKPLIEQIGELVCDLRPSE